MQATQYMPTLRSIHAGCRRPSRGLNGLTALAFSFLAASGCITSNGRGVVDTQLATSGLAAVAANGGSPDGHCELGGTAPLEDRPPAELNKTTLPCYRIEPPDVLLLEGVRLAPKAPYYIGFQDTLQIVGSGTLPEVPLAAVFQVDSSGQVDLGPGYGVVKIQGLTLDEASDAIARQLRGILNSPQVSVTLIEPAGQQIIGGEHQVAPDGTINLGIYGSVFVAGMTVDEARSTVESVLAEYFEEPSVSLEVFAYQSKVYYVIVEGPGDQVISLPVTGNETVLDAIARIGGPGQFASKRIWISRPAPHGVGCDQVLPVDWVAITKGASAATNYQILPGDRVFVSSDRLSLADEFVSRIINPFERAMGFTLLGGQAIQTVQRFPGGGL